MTPEDRAAIRARLAAATPGPWDSDGLSVGRDDEWIAHVTEHTVHGTAANADLIAHAPTDLAALLDALDEALDTVEDLVAQHCYAESDGSYDTSALSTNRDAFDLLVRAGRAKYVGKQVGRRAFIRLTEATP